MNTKLDECIKTLTAIRDGEPWPDPLADIKAAHTAGKTVQRRVIRYTLGGVAEWSAWIDQPDPCFSPADGLEEWRIKPVPVMVPLGPEDVPPGSALRNPTWLCGSYRMPSQVSSAGVYFFDVTSTAWEILRRHWQINRSIPLTGRWDKDAWTACEKEEVQP